MKLRKRVRDVERLKEEGNSAFKAGKLDEAVEKYSEALDVSYSSLSDWPNAEVLYSYSVSEKQKKRVEGVRSVQRCFQTVPPLF